MPSIDLTAPWAQLCKFPKKRWTTLQFSLGSFAETRRTNNTPLCSNIIMSPVVCLRELVHAAFQPNWDTQLISFRSCRARFSCVILSSVNGLHPKPRNTSPGFENEIRKMDSPFKRKQVNKYLYHQRKFHRQREIRIGISTHDERRCGRQCEIGNKQPDRSRLQLEPSRI